jgi:hypothetical protein
MLNKSGKFYVEKVSKLRNYTKFRAHSGGKF